MNRAVLSKSSEERQSLMMKRFNAGFNLHELTLISEHAWITQIWKTKSQPYKNKPHWKVYGFGTTLG